MIKYEVLGRNMEVLEEGNIEDDATEIHYTNNTGKEVYLEGFKIILWDGSIREIFYNKRNGSSQWLKNGATHVAYIRFIYNRFPSEYDEKYYI